MTTTAAAPDFHVGLAPAPPLPPSLIGPGDIPFLLTILDNVDDDQPRLVYADYLEESGDPLAALIRAQCEAQRNGMSKRLFEAIGDAHAEIFKRLPLLLDCFFRGLPYRIDSLFPGWEDCLRYYPVERVTNWSVYKRDGGWRIATHPPLRDRDTQWRASYPTRSLAVDRLIETINRDRLITTTVEVTARGNADGTGELQVLQDGPAEILSIQARAGAAFQRFTLFVWDGTEFPPVRTLAQYHMGYGKQLYFGQPIILPARSRLLATTSNGGPVAVTMTWRRTGESCIEAGHNLVPFAQHDGAYYARTR